MTKAKMIELVKSMVREYDNELENMRKEYGIGSELHQLALARWATAKTMADVLDINCHD